MPRFGERLRAEARGVTPEAREARPEFEGGAHGQIAVKVIDDRGNELLVVRSLREAEA